MKSKGREKRMKHKCDKASGLIETLRVSNKTAVVHCGFFLLPFFHFILFFTVHHYIFNPLLYIKRNLNRLTVLCNFD